jgi:methyl coenzyme M reductase subunit C-like uncharacterized protein (methanogenesis marker protein 7)
LHITGRDVEENDHALSFDPATGSWTILDGSVEQHTMSDTRALIARYVRDYYPGSKPADLAAALGLGRDLVKQTCRRMVDDRQLTVQPGGAYYPATHNSSTRDLELSLVSPLSPRGAEQQEHR